ncbi:NmrA family NAD(P)-binding protein [Phormidesmis sp. 146-12]
MASPLVRNSSLWANGGSLEAYRESILKGQLADPRDGNSVVYQLAEDDHATFAMMALLDPQSWLWQGFDTASDALTVREMAAAFGRVVGRTVEHVQISWEEERQVAGDEVVRLAQWVDRDGPRMNIQAYRQKYPWLTPLEHYLRTHGWENIALKS